MDPKEAQNGPQIDPFGAPGGVRKQDPNRDRFLDDFGPFWGRFWGPDGGPEATENDQKTTKKATKKKKNDTEKRPKKVEGRRG